MGIKKEKFRAVHRFGHAAAVLLTAAFLTGAVSGAAQAADTSPVIDPARTASLTLYKVKENDGRVINGTGNPDAAVTQTGMKGVLFGILKVAEITTAAADGEVGTYYTDVNAGLLKLCTDNGVTISSESIGGKVCYTSEALTAAVSALNCVSGAVPGEVQAADYVRSHRDTIRMTETDTNGYTKKDGLPLGLYLVAELDSQGYSETAGGGAKEVISNPASPFLVSLPMSDRAGESADHWQYAVTAYPKNQTVSVPKYLVAEDDGKTLLQSADFEIGETVHQVIAPAAPAPVQLESAAAVNRNYETYVVTDVMEKGLSLLRVTSVRLGPLTVRPASTDAFSGFTELKAGEDYRVLKGTAGQTLFGAGDAKGTKAFRVEFLDAGIRKLNALKSAGQVAVFFDSVVTKDASDGEGLANTNQPSLTLKHVNTSDATVKGNQPRVYTYRLNLRKQGLQDASASAFSVTRGGNAVTFVKESEGIYHLFDSDTDAASSGVTAVHPAAGGKMVLRGLDADTYTFTERQTQSGFELLTASFQVTLYAKDPADGSLDRAELSTQGKKTSVPVEKGTAGLVVHNRRSFSLRTGGAGVLLFYVLSAAALIGAAVMTFRGKRHRGK